MSALRAAVAVLALAAGALLTACDDDEPVLDLDRPADVGTGAPSPVP